MNQRNIPFVDLKAQHNYLKKEIENAFNDVINNSSFIRGKEVSQFENSFSSKLKINNCISCANGTDAIYIALKSLNLKADDEVITTSLSWIATSEAITHAGAKVVFCDIDPESYCINPELIEPLINKNTVGILPVHIYGQPCEMNSILNLAEKYKLWIIEDCAQSHLAKYEDTYTGKFGLAGTFSFYPSKNLGAIGDAGCIITNDNEKARWMKSFANHGGKNKHIVEGINSRLDSIQAAILNIKIRFLSEWTNKRRELAKKYLKELSNVGDLKLPFEKDSTEHVYHLFTIRTAYRDELKTFLESNGISTTINYPKPLPLLSCYSRLNLSSAEFPISSNVCNEILALPLYPELSLEDQNYIIQNVKNFFNNKL